MLLLQYALKIGHGREEQHIGKTSILFCLKVNCRSVKSSNKNKMNKMAYLKKSLYRLIMDQYFCIINF